ncbi:MAG: hypothetical protein WBX01_13880 [Nitrososphaeraceae archaeon]
MDRSDHNHSKLIIEQFTKQAIPFAKKSAQHIDETFEKILVVVDVDKSDNVLDVACGTGSISTKFAELSNYVTAVSREVDIGITHYKR